MRNKLDILNKKEYRSSKNSRVFGNFQHGNRTIIMIGTKYLVQNDPFSKVKCRR